MPFDIKKIRLPENRKGRKSKAFQIQYDNQLKEFSNALIELNKTDLGNQKVSSRGWCYLLEGFGAIDKSEFDYAQKLINNCRKLGYLPMDFVDADKNRQWFNLDDVNKKYETPLEYLIDKLDNINWWHRWKKDIKFWQFQNVFIQMMVEKIDVLNLFKPLCRKYHIPIANAKGWSDLMSRNDMALRFKWAQGIGLKCVLLYYADLDPAGVLIVEKLKKNLKQIEKATKYDPKDLIVDKFGLNYDFIENNHLLWIDNLITGSGKKADERKQYVKDYIDKFGRRKCEANAILPIRKVALKHCEETILKYLDEDAFEEWERRIKVEQKEVKYLLDRTDIHKYKRDLIPILEIIQQERLIFNYISLLSELDKEILLNDQESLIFNFMNLIKIKKIPAADLSTKDHEKELNLDEQVERLQDCYNEVCKKLSDIRLYNYWSDITLEKAYQIILENAHNVSKIISVIKEESGLDDDDDDLCEVKVPIISKEIEKVVEEVKEKERERVRIRV